MKQLLRFTNWFLLPVVFMVACNTGTRIKKSQAKKILADSSARIYSLDEPTTREINYYITPSGKRILLRSNAASIDSSGIVALEVTEAVISADAPTVGNKAGPDDPFKGKIRVTPKTSFSTKKFENFRTIPALYRDLKSKEFMNNLGIGNRNERHDLENRNVFIEKAYLYTITLLEDNDLHLLIGNTPTYIEGVTRVFNAEISGIPVSGSSETKEQIRKVRQKAINAFAGIPLCGRKGYLQSNNQIWIKGSLFYDTHHTSAPAKCREVEGESAWEIHPVWDIGF